MSTVVAFSPLRSGREEWTAHPAKVVAIDSRARAARRAGRSGHFSATGAHPAELSGPPLRLTRRGRAVAAVLLALLIAVVVATGVALIQRPAQAGEQVRPIPASYHVVLPGETLWSIAGQLAPSADRRDTIDRIIEFNALSSAGLHAGQRVAIPGDLTGQ